MMNWRDKIKASGLTQTQIADRLGVKASAVSMWLSGERDIPARRVSDVAREFRIPPHEIRPDIFPAPQPEAAQ